jgi:hypothetical protein
MNTRNFTLALALVLGLTGCSTSDNSTLPLEDAGKLDMDIVIIDKYYKDASKDVDASLVDVVELDSTVVDTKAVDTTTLDVQVDVQLDAKSVDTGVDVVVEDVTPTDGNQSDVVEDVTSLDVIEDTVQDVVIDVNPVEDSQELDVLDSGSNEASLADTTVEDVVVAD